MLVLIPNYVFIQQCFMAIEALADGGVKAGLSRQQALKLAAHTLLVRLAIITIIGEFVNTDLLL